ncbi:hypothetical protein ACFSTJ_20225 [Ottowia pentelensis]|uniref:hypothetical protein n=1 Tax=Ottowia pentelensis TaxID=511108 RepID=UPI00362B7FBA
MATSSRNSTRSLTKSRFKLATECPRKLFYTGKREYLDRSLDDSFLAALADGGYQVGELARLAYADGVRIDELDHAAALERTAALLQQDEVTVFEAALSVGNLFIRVDILRKCGQAVELIEVKAKSYRAEKDRDFRGAKGQIQSGFHPYLLDVAFQRHVAQAALPDCQVKAFCCWSTRTSAPPWMGSTSVSRSCARMAACGCSWLPAPARVASVSRR